MKSITSATKSYFNRIVVTLITTKAFSTYIYISTLRPLEGHLASAYIYPQMIMRAAAVEKRYNNSLALTQVDVVTDVQEEPAQ